MIRGGTLRDQSDGCVKHYSYSIAYYLVYQHLYQEQFDMILIENTPDSRLWNTYNALRIHLFDPTLFYLLSFDFSQKHLTIMYRDEL